MANSLNKVQLIGNIGQKPRVQEYDDKKVAQFTLATNFGSRDNEQTEWHNIVAWSPQAEIAEKYIKKGSRIYVEGRLRTRKWQGKDGIDRYTTEIIASQIILLDRAESAGTDRQTPPPPTDAPRRRAENQAAQQPMFNDDDDLPADF